MEWNPLFSFFQKRQKADEKIMSENKFSMEIVRAGKREQKFKLKNIFHIPCNAPLWMWYIKHVEFRLLPSLIHPPASRVEFQRRKRKKSRLKRAKLKDLTRGWQLNLNAMWAHSSVNSTSISSRNIRTFPLLPIHAQLGPGFVVSRPAAKENFPPWMSEHCEDFFSFLPSIFSQQSIITTARSKSYNIS